MKIHNYNSHFSKYRLIYEANSLHPNLLIADILMTCGPAGDSMGVYYTVPIMPDSAVIDFAGTDFA